MPDNLETITAAIEEKLGSLSEIERIDGGLVHFVYKLRLKDQTVFLKIRGDNFALAPIVTKRELILYETAGLKIANDIAPGYFPQLIQYDNKMGYMVISDVLPGGSTLESIHAAHNADTELYAKIGDVVAMAHLALDNNSKEDDGIVSGPELDRQKLSYLTEKLGKEDADNFYKLYRAQPKQFIHGDLSPKNILVKDEIIRFCDLDSFREGAVEIDQAWIIAHTIIHSYTKDEAINLIGAFVRSYKSKHPISVDTQLFILLVGMALLHRLDNNLLKYKMRISDEGKGLIAQRLRSKLRNIETLEELVDNFFLK